LLSSQIGRPPGPCQSGIQRLRATGTKSARRGCQPAGCSSAAPMHKHWGRVHFPSQPKIFPLTHITSNLSTHAWSIKRR
jgi:hypothetical protein